jgi:hypothetical protein
VVLALHVIRTPKEETGEAAEERPVDLSLVKARRGFVFPA